jgi:hypothetical protein
LWFWFAFLQFVGCLQLFIRISTILIPAIRKYIIINHLGSRFNNERLCSYLDQNCNIGDWFLLNQIAKNTNKYFFKEFIDNLTSKSGQVLVESRALLKFDDPEDGKQEKFELKQTKKA